FQFPISKKYSSSNVQTIKIKGNKSSQFLSALLMISPYIAPLRIEVVGELVSKPYIDITLKVMKAFGVKVKNNSYKSFDIKPQVYKATNYQIEGDASAASYWTSIAYLHGGKVEFTNLNNRSIQGDIGFLESLKQLKKRGPRVIDMESMPDTAMTLATIAPFAKRQTKITGLSTLKLKETDRLKALENELRKVGIRVKTTKNSITIEGAKTFSRLRDNVRIGTYDDHRMAMSFAVLGTKVPGIKIEDPGCTAKTYPNFWKDLELAYLSPIKLGDKNLILTGMRCSGKTYFGKKIAKLLKREFVDLDTEIEKQKNMKIQDIVKRYGWPYFRKVEQKVCSEFSDTKNLVIGTGGGVVLDEKNMKNLKKNGVNIFIFADIPTLVERIKKSTNRPSLTGKKIDKELSDVWEERRDLYLKYADYVWDDTSGGVVKNNLEQIFCS
ncbi:hypothetical protein KKA95_01515, partial [Patescibacteria group bacterium]|nr:hypothetical protein [Patescibacteria group bacterium]